MEGVTKTTVSTIRPQPQQMLKKHTQNGPEFVKIPLWKRHQKKGESETVFLIFYRKCLKTGPERRGEKVQFSSFFSLGGHLGPQGLPMELPGDSEEHFFKILARFRQNFGSFFDVFGQICWPDFMELLQKIVFC